MGYACDNYGMQPLNHLFTEFVLQLLLTTASYLSKRESLRLVVHAHFCALERLAVLLLLSKYEKPALVDNTYLDLGYSGYHENLIQ